MASILGIGAYIPRLRLSRKAMSLSLGWLTSGAGSGKGSRAMAFWDEDSVTMAIAAARVALAGADRVSVKSMRFATTTAPFAEPQNASFVRAALRLSEECLAEDVGGTPRASLLALHSALETGQATLIAAGDVPPGLAGSVNEARAGDAGAAALTGNGPGLLRYLGGASSSTPFAERYRVAGHDFPQDWEERWVREEGYLGQVPQVIARAIERAGLSSDEIDHFILPCSIPGVPAAVSSAAGLKNARLASGLAESVGDSGAAHALLMLAYALEGVAPGQKVLVAQLGQGATALVFEAEAAVADMDPSVTPMLERGVEEHSYAKLLAFRGRVAWDRGLRGRFIVNEALSTAWRYSESLLGFVGGRCRETGRVQFPPSRLASGTGIHLDSQEPWPLADLGGSVATFTADLLAFSANPPNCYGLVDLNGGGRLLMEFTDPGAAEITPGTPVNFVFRIKDIDPHSGYCRYFWKATAATSAA